MVQIMEKRITIFVSHPNFDNSLCNKHLEKVVLNNDLFRVHHLDKKMEKGYFDLEAEKALLRESDGIVWQFPIYWYNSPASLREWQDQVLSPIVYSSDNFLKGKPVMVVFTAGAGEEQYSHEGLNRYTAEEMLRPFEMTANASGMVWKKPLGFYSCGNNLTEEDWGRMEAQYLKALEDLTK